MTETLTIGRQTFDFEVFWLSWRQETRPQPAPADLIVLAFEQDLPPATWIAVLVGDQPLPMPGDGTCAFCGPLQDRRDLWFVPPAGNSSWAQILALPGAEIDGAAPSATAPPGPILRFRRFPRTERDEALHAGEAFAIDAVELKVAYPASRDATTSEPWRAQSQRWGDGSYAPAVRRLDSQASFRLAVTLPEAASVPVTLRGLPSRRDGVPPPVLRLDLSTASRDSPAALDLVQIAYVNRQYLGSRTAPWGAPIHAEAGDLLVPQTWTRRPEAPVRSFTVSYFGPGDLFFVFARQARCRIALVLSNGNVEPPIAIDGVQVFALGFDGRLKPCTLAQISESTPDHDDVFGFPPLSQAAYLRLARQLETARASGAWTKPQDAERTQERGHRRWLETNFAAFRPSAGRNDRFQRMLPAVTAPLPFFFMARRYADLVEPASAAASARPEAAAERLFGLLDPNRPDFLAALCSPAWPYAAASVTRLDELARQSSAGDFAADLLRPLFDLMVREWKGNVSATDTIGRRLDAAADWYNEKDPLARLALLRLGATQDRWRIAARLVAYGLKPGLADLGSVKAIEDALAFVERHFEAGPQRDAATLAALRYATDELAERPGAGDEFGPIRHRLAADWSSAAQKPEGSLLPLQTLRNWRQLTRAGSVVSQLDRLRRWIRGEYEAGRCRLSFIPAAGLDRRLLGSRAKLVQELTKEMSIPPQARRLVDEAINDRWEGAALAALVNVLKAIAAAADFKLPRHFEGRDVRLTRTIAQEILNNAGSLAFDPSETLKTYAVAAVPFLAYRPSEQDARNFVVLAERANINVAAIERSLWDLHQKLTGGEGLPARPSGAVAANARGIVALDSKTWLNRFAELVARRLDRRFDRLSAARQDAAPSSDRRTSAATELQRLEARYRQSVRPALASLRQARLSDLFAQPAETSARLRDVETLFDALARLKASIAAD